MKAFLKQVGKERKVKIRLHFVMALLLTGPLIASAAEGEMGVGTPQFGVYSNAPGAHVSVWSLTNATTSFPAGCGSLILTPTTMGMDAYKAAIAIMLAAKVTNKKVRFYAHGPRDNGCGVDYVELFD